jgi:hypothetical protein
MEKIKKTIFRKMTTTTTDECDEKCHIIIPDLNAVYHIKFGLISELQDIGFFNAYFDESNNTI